MLFRRTNKLGSRHDCYDRHMTSAAVFLKNKKCAEYILCSVGVLRNLTMSSPAGQADWGAGALEVDLRKIGKAHITLSALSD